MSGELDSWEDVIRTACKEYKQTMYALAREAKVDQGQLRRFVSGEQSIGLVTAEKLGRVLGITLQRASKQSRRSK
jgi:transcriptional regulator with XRE-family HTH domain